MILKHPELHNISWLMKSPLSITFPGYIYGFILTLTLLQFSRTDKSL